MLFALVVATLAAATAAGVTALLQKKIGQRAQRDAELKRRLNELAREAGGTVTPRGVARALGVTPIEADRLLRSMVDDDQLSMDFDVQHAELRFSFRPEGAEVDALTGRPRGSRGA